MSDINKEILKEVAGIRILLAEQIHITAAIGLYLSAGNPNIERQINDGLRTAHEALDAIKMVREKV